MKRIASLIAIGCALVCAAEPVKLAPSTPKEFTDGAKLETTDGALLVRTTGSFISKQHVAVDKTKPGRLTLEYKLAPGAKPDPFVVSLDVLDAKGIRIVGAHIFPIKTTETELAADAKKGDKTLKIKDASQWQDIPLKRGTMVAFNVKEDLSDLPNRTVSGLIESVSPEGEVTLRVPLRVGYPAGTRVRVHRDIGSFGIGSTYRRAGEEWQKLTIEIKPDSKDEAYRWWSFAEKVGPRFGFVRGKINEDAGLLIRNIEFTQE